MISSKVQNRNDFVFSLDLKNLFFGQTWNQRNYLISPVIDFLLSGGGAVLLLSIIYLFSIEYLDGLTGFILIIILTHIFADPHGLASYPLFYKDFRSQLKDSQLSLFFRAQIFTVGYLLPLGLVLFFLILPTVENLNWTHVFFDVATFAFGWHITKQGYGVWVILSAFKKIYYTKLEKDILRYNSYLMWIFIWTSLPNDYFPFIHYDFFPIKKLFVLFHESYISELILISSITTVIYVILQSHIKKKLIPSLTALCAYSTVYILYAGLIQIPLWIVICAFFHGAQYSLFTITLDHNKYMENIPKISNIKAWIKAIKKYLVIIFIGAIIFEILPKSEWNLNEYWFDFYKDQSKLILEKYPRASVGDMVAQYFAVFAMCVSFHHYFIDNIIWRRDNISLLKYFKR